ncbi:glycosyltransferase family 4 protein [Aurantivibrio plasticivorans]
MKLAFVVFKYFSFGGMQRNMLAIAKACASQGDQVDVLCSQWQGEQPNYLTVKILPVSGFRNAAQMKNFSRAFQQVVNANQYDLVVGFNKFPALDAYYAGDSCFATKAFEDRSWFYRQTLRSKIYLEYEAAVFSCDSKTQVLEVSANERRQFQKHYRTPDDRFHTLNPGINPNRRVWQSDLDAQKRKRQELGIDDSTLIFLAIGSGFKTKGLERSIELLAQWAESPQHQDREAILLVAGQDKEASFVLQAKRLGVNDSVRFLGGRDDIPQLLQIADVVLHPAHRENTGNVLLEAMIAGRPVIATEVCGYAHFIDDAEMGVVLAKDFSPSDYLQAVEDVLAEDDQVWRERGKLFAQREEIYSRPQQVAKLLTQFAKGKEG